MKRWIFCIFLAVIFAFGGFFFGQYVAMKRAIKGIAIGDLSVMTAVHQKIANQEYGEANKTIEKWMDGQAAIMSAVDKSPFYVWQQIVPGKPDPMRRLAPKFLKDANEYFSKKPETLRPETLAYLNDSTSSKQ